MALTAREIERKTFEKRLRGFDPQEVEAYMKVIAKDWERLVEQNKEQKARLEKADRELAQLREVEQSLFKTLKTAEDTSTNMVEQANKEADLKIKEAEVEGESIVREARQQAKKIIADAEQMARDTAGKMREDLRELEMEFRTAENYRDNLLMELKNLANDALTRVERMNANKVVLKRENYQPEEKEVEETPDFEFKVNTSFEPETEELKNDEGEEGSFFDEL